jgi:CRP-like cAMP-binding protein
MNQPKVQYKNRVLASLPKSEIARLEPHLHFVELPQHKTLAGGVQPYAYFLEDGIASAVVTVDNGNTVEVGVIGIDGMVGVPILIGSNHSPIQLFMQIAGSAYRIEARELKAEFERDGELRRHLQKYVQAFMVQTAQTAACNRLHTIEERLARWLSTCRDRMPSDRLALTQEFLGQMLGSPRTTVTLAAGLLEKAGLIEHSRGIVTVRNRKGLEGAACECYGAVRDEYGRLGLL